MTMNQPQQEPSNYGSRPYGASQENPDGPANPRDQAGTPPPRQPLQRIRVLPVRVIVLLVIVLLVIGGSIAVIRYVGSVSVTQTNATATAQAQLKTATAQAQTATATAVPSVMITSPRNKDMVGSSITIYGKASNIPTGMELWLFVKEENIFGYFPQLVGDATNPRPIMIFSDGTWSIDVQIGQENDSAAVGKTLTLIPVLINQHDQEAHNAIKNYFQQQGSYRGIEQTSGMQLLAQDQVQVVRM